MPRRSAGPFVALGTGVALALSGCAYAESADSPGDPQATEQGSPKTTHADDVVKRTRKRTHQSIAYSRRVIHTDLLTKGETKLQQEGRPGLRIRLVRITWKNGKAVDRDVIKTFVAREPVDEVKLVGTHEAEPEPAPEPDAASGCDPNYAGACVPIASDVDCAGGSGDGPEYVEGPVRVVGDDVYDLNRDDDDIACDS